MTLLLAQSQMIGFNLGLGRSSEGDVSHGDTIGIVSSGTNGITEFAQVTSLILIWILISFHSPPNMPLLTSRDQMGSIYSYNGPMKCFNGPKTYQLGWFRSHYETIYDISYEWAGRLYGLADVSNISSSSIMIVKLVHPNASDSQRDVYVSFNRAIGNNADTGEGINQVVVHEALDLDTVSVPQSYLLGKMGAGGSYAVTVNGVEVVIRVIEINLSASPAYAFVTIGNASPSSQPSVTPSLEPSVTSVPSMLPSVTPSNIPSSSLQPSAEFPQYRDVLVLFVTDGVNASPDGEASGTAGSMEDKFFGTYGDPVNVKSIVSNLSGPVDIIIMRRQRFRC
jgi:hypothetical protein